MQNKKIKGTSINDTKPTNKHYFYNERSHKWLTVFARDTNNNNYNTINF